MRKRGEVRPGSGPSKGDAERAQDVRALRELDVGALARASIADLFAQREAQASVALDNDPEMRTHCLARCDHCQREGTDGYEVLVTAHGARLCAPGKGCQADLPPVPEMPKVIEAARRLKRGTMALLDQDAGIDTSHLSSADPPPTLVSTQAELDALLGEGALVMPQAGGLIEVRALSPDEGECARYLGIDPGLANLGVFVLGLTATSVRCLHRETFHTDASHSLPARLRLIGRKLLALVAHWRPHAVGYENLLGVTTGKEMAGKGNADRGPLLMICGQLELACLIHDVQCRAYATSTARVAVLGRGKTRGAGKTGTRTRVEQMTGTRKLSLDQSDAASFAFAAYADRRP